MPTLLAHPTGKGAVRVAHRLRHYVKATDWCRLPGTDFLWNAGPDAPTTANLNGVAPANIVVGLNGFGWVTSALAFDGTNTGDFMSAADDTPPNLNGADASDLLRSPHIFGDYAHALAAGQFLGYMPTRLVCEFYGAFTVNSADENATYMGLWNASGQVATVYSNSTNFVFNDGATTEVGAAVDTAYHQFRISLDSQSGNVTWYIDGAPQGSQAIIADRWPAGFGFVTTTTNRVALSWGHIWYE